MRGADSRKFQLVTDRCDIGAVPVNFCSRVRGGIFVKLSDAEAHAPRRGREDISAAFLGCRVGLMIEANPVSTI